MNAIDAAMVRVAGEDAASDAARTRYVLWDDARRCIGCWEYSANGDLPALFASPEDALEERERGESVVAVVDELGDSGCLVLGNRRAHIADLRREAGR